MRENRSTTCLGLTLYVCYDGDIDNDVLDRAVERLANSGTWVNGHSTYGLMGELGRYIAQERCNTTVVNGSIQVDFEDGKIVAPQVEEALSKKFNRQSDGTWILK
jgi:hypothetical protein